jgi:hypothetical protein
LPGRACLHEPLACGHITGYVTRGQTTHRCCATLKGASCTDDLETILRWVGAVLTATVTLAALPAAAQSSMLPAPCAGKAGEALDNCVRDITPFEPPRVYAKETAPDPRRPLNCKAVDKADMNFCVARNEIVMECANQRKHPDFDQCFASYISNPPLPKAADCSRVPAEKAADCKLRNKV